jgi:hypothetical protein
MKFCVEVGESCSSKGNVYLNVTSCSCLCNINQRVGVMKMFMWSIEENVFLNVT